MYSQRSPVRQLILLVGSNPLPNFLAVLILKAESVCFLFTLETEPVMARLKDILTQKYPDLALSERFIQDSTSPSRIRESLPQVNADTHLHYTGGTKIMSAHALMNFLNQGGSSDRASYLDERKSLLRFDDDNVPPIDLSKVEFNLTIREILGLHGITVKSIGSELHTGINRPSIDDAKAVAAKVLDDPSLASKLYEQVNGMPEAITKARATPLNLARYVQGLSVESIPGDGWNKSLYEVWKEFLKGGWVEVWCGDLVHQLATDGAVHIDIQCLRKKNRDFQIDVMLVRGHRLYVISCTTEAVDINLCKSKLFEVATRARQLGGDLARAAFISLLDGTVRINNVEELKMDLLRNDIVDIWDASNEVQAFGLADVRAWHGYRGIPNIHNLKAWLEK